jgi:hypothetical protein
MFVIQAHDSSRVVSVSVDSANHARVFSALVYHNEGRAMKMQTVGALFGADGKMSQGIRTFMTRDSSGTGDSKSVRLPDTDTARVRALTAEVLRRCVR